MAFKMRSGNKVSFKNMGGSPAKVTDYTKELTGDASAADAVKNTRASILERKYAEEQRIANQSALNNMPTKQERRDENIQEERMSRSKDGKIGAKLVESIKDRDKRGEFDYGSKEKLKQEKKIRKTTSKTNDVTEDRKILGMKLPGKLGTRKYTKEERRKDKDKTLEDRAQREKGTGKSKTSFNVRKAILGGSSAAGIEKDAAYKSTERKIKKRKTRQEAKETRKAGRDDREKLSPGTVASRYLGGKGSKKDIAIKKEMESGKNNLGEEGIDRKEAKYNIKYKKAIEKGKKKKAMRLSLREGTRQANLHLKNKRKKERENK